MADFKNRIKDGFFSCIIFYTFKEYGFEGRQPCSTTREERIDRVNIFLGDISCVYQKEQQNLIYIQMCSGVEYSVVNDFVISDLVSAVGKFRMGEHKKPKVRREYANNFTPQ